MFRRATLITLLMAATSLLPQSSAEVGDDGTTVALTATVFTEAGASERDLMGALLALLEAEVSMQPGLSVVERRQIDLALLELALSEDLGRNAATRLQLGKIVSADLILTLELMKPENENEDETPRVLIRIVESLTGIVRGVSVAPVEEARLDETAGQIARYLALIEGAPERPPITVAVAPFECQGRFDRLRPLELGLSDMIATRLLRWSDTIAKEQTAKENGQGDKQASRFQVLQRSSMQELLRELEMIQSGLVDRTRLPANLPTRAAAFLVRGEVDENNDAGEFRVVVSGELVHAASNKAVRDFKFEAKPEELEVSLAHQVDLLAGRLLNSKDKLSRAPGPLREIHEVDSLLSRVAGDLRRFRRIRPTDFSYRDFELPAGGHPVGSPISPADTPLGLAILKKSIARLEATLFINPDRADAAYALGFCYSFHIKDIWNPDRADELLRRAAGSDPDGKLGADALRLLAEISFHHQTGKISEGQDSRAFDQMLYALQNMPEKYRDAMWVRLLSEISPLLSTLGDTTKRMQLIEVAAAEAEREGSPHQYRMAMAIDRLSAGLKSGDGGYDPSPLLLRWVEGDDLTLKRTAARSLANISLGQREYERAAKWYLLGAERVNAARCLRMAGKTEQAIELLESCEPQNHTSSIYGSYAVELGKCYMKLNENEKALNLMVTAAERVPSLRDNSRVEEYINQLGGVPLSEDRDVDVEYIAGPDGNTIHSSALATDGTSLFTSGAFQSGMRRGVSAFDVKRQLWESLTTPFGAVTSMAVHDGELWVGTANEGIWRCALSSNHWTQWSAKQGLPDDRVTVLTVSADGVFAGVGTTAAGGAIRIREDDRVEVLDGKAAPDLAPSFLFVQGEQLLAATRSGVYEFDLEQTQWTKTVEASGLREVRVFPGKSHAWASTYRREIYPYGADEAEAERFKAAWFNERGKAGIRTLFGIEHNGQVWFGGYPWARFRSVGLYRVDPKTGEFRMYGLRDGFRMSTTYTTHAAVAIGDDLWVATSAGLARMTPRQSIDTSR